MGEVSRKREEMRGFVCWKWLGWLAGRRHFYVYPPPPYPLFPCLAEWLGCLCALLNVDLEKHTHTPRTAAVAAPLLSLVLLPSLPDVSVQIHHKLLDEVWNHAIVPIIVKVPESHGRPLLGPATGLCFLWIAGLEAQAEGGHKPGQGYQTKW